MDRHRVPSFTTTAREVLTDVYIADEVDAEIAELKGRNKYLTSSRDGYRVENAELKDKLHDQEEYNKAYAEEWKAELPNIREDAIREMRTHWLMNMENDLTQDKVDLANYMEEYADKLKDK